MGRILPLLGAVIIIIPVHAIASNLAEMEQHTIQQCIQTKHDTQFCRCWVTTWVRLWSDDDYRSWVSQDNTATKHMQETQTMAAQQCQ